ncbi:CsbD family protein [Janthinobacterium sp.]|uniref:CsbD family protein n=1 Tax=Janthinobacterium sp. TaxID=1871054 RepID=UPI00293D7C57|nr:CsbD family protein [Janthinobacterium sp.]
MNKNQIKGEAKDVGGKIQEEVGKLVGSSEQQAKGLANQLEGKVQKQVGNLQEAVSDANKQAEKDANKK